MNTVTFRHTADQDYSSAVLPISGIFFCDLLPSLTPRRIFFLVTVFSHPVVIVNLACRLLPAVYSNRFSILINFYISLDLNGTGPVDTPKEFLCCLFPVCLLTLRNVITLDNNGERRGNEDKSAAPDEVYHTLFRITGRERLSAVRERTRANRGLLWL